METFCMTTMQPPLFELKLKTFPSLHCGYNFFYLGLAAKFRMHLIGSLIKLNRICDVFLHGRFVEKFIKSWKISLATYKNM